MFLEIRHVVSGMEFLIFVVDGQTFFGIGKHFVSFDNSMVCLAYKITIFHIRCMYSYFV